MKRSKRSEAFKKDAVTLSYHSGKAISVIAEDLSNFRSLLVRCHKEHSDREKGLSWQWVAQADTYGRRKPVAQKIAC